MSAIAAAIVIGAGISAYGSYSSSSKQASDRSAQSQAVLDQIGAIRSGLMDGSYYGFSAGDVFGRPVDSEAALYNPVNITESQRQSIAGNLANFDSANQLSRITSNANTDLDLARINKLFPNFNENLDQFSGVTASLLRGENPFPEDVYGIVSDRQSLAGSLGIPGGAQPATLKDLGLNRLQLATQGAGMFQDFIRTADAISPVAAQFRPQQSFLMPSERLEADIRQAENEQQGRLSAAIIEASPDPRAAGIFGMDYQAQLALAGANVNVGGNWGNALSAVGQGVSALGQYYGGKQNYQYGSGTYGTSSSYAPYAVDYSASRGYQAQTLPG